MIKIIETTQLAAGLTSFHTEIDGVVDTSSSLGERYDYYKRALANNERVDRVRNNPTPSIAPAG